MHGNAGESCRQDKEFYQVPMCGFFKRLRDIRYKDGPGGGDRDPGHMCLGTPFDSLRRCSGVSIQVCRGRTPPAHNQWPGDGWDCTCNDCRGNNNQ